MRRAPVALVVGALAILLAPSVAAANPALMPLQLQLRDMVMRISTASPAAPDLTVLTTEPVTRTESSGYGWREDPIRKRQKFHHGTDYRGKRGTPILAAGSGTVIFAARRGGYGKVVFIDHGNGIITRYAHLNRITTKVGATIAAGEQIGQLGSTGRTTGPHLHFEVRLDGRSVDPNTALMVAAIMRESPVAGAIAAYSLAPELQTTARDMQDPKNRKKQQRPERKHAPKRDKNLM